MSENMHSQPLVSATEIVNISRYPIHDTDSSARTDLINQCHRDLEAKALCYLSAFLTEKALRRMSEEMASLQPVALRNDYLRTAYGWMDNSGFPPEHPRSVLFKRRMDYLITDQVATDSLIRQLFHWDVLTNFIRDALGFKTLYRSTCPTQSIQLNIMHEGDVLPWHFDTNDGVVSLLIDAADNGGEFQVAPYVRAEDNENYDGVLDVFREKPGSIYEPGMPPGTFILFKGRRSVHRVSPVGQTNQPRTIVLYSYDERPNMKFPQASQDRLRYPDPSPYLGANTPLDSSGFSEWAD